jgi:riboflavin kinase/FMN adenylyltransferase
MTTVEFGQKINQSVVVALGYMDCVHIGHQKLVEAAQKAADFLRDFTGARVYTAAFTFSNNPFSALKKDILPIYDLRTRLKKLDTDYAITAEFDEKFASTSAADFLEALLGMADVRAVVAGADYKFSVNAGAGIEFLRDYLARRGVDLIVADTVKVGGEKVASSSIRELLKSGAVKEANVLLGSPYTVSGTVIKGARVGTSLGFPTANVLPKDGLVRLMSGVYSTKTRINSGYFTSITNVGCRPTFGGAEYIYETHIDAINYDLYGKYIEIEFFDRMRDIVKFESKEELVEQLKKDKKIFDLPY